MVLAHAMDNRTGEVYAENGIYVHQMEDHREEQEPVPPYLRHDGVALEGHRKRSGCLLRGDAT